MIFPTNAGPIFPIFEEIAIAAWRVAMRLVAKQYDEQFDLDDWGWMLESFNRPAFKDRVSGYENWGATFRGKVKDDEYDCTLSVDVTYPYKENEARPSGTVIVRYVSFRKCGAGPGAQPTGCNPDLIGDLQSGYEVYTEITTEVVDEPAGSKPECYGSWS